MLGVAPEKTEEVPLAFLIFGKPQATMRRRNLFVGKRNTLFARLSFGTSSSETTLQLALGTGHSGSGSYNYRSAEIPTAFAEAAAAKRDGMACLEVICRTVEALLAARTLGAPPQVVVIDDGSSRKPTRSSGKVANTRHLVRRVQL